MWMFSPISPGAQSQAQAQDTPSSSPSSPESSTADQFHRFQQSAVQEQLRAGLCHQECSQQVEGVDCSPLFSPSWTAWSTRASFGLPNTVKTLKNWSKSTVAIKMVQGLEHGADEEKRENCAGSLLEIGSGRSHCC